MTTLISDHHDLQPQDYAAYDSLHAPLPLFLQSIQHIATTAFITQIERNI